MARFSNGIYFPDEYALAEGGVIICNVGWRNFTKLYDGLAAVGAYSWLLDSGEIRASSQILISNIQSAVTTNYGSTSVFEFNSDTMYIRADYGFYNTAPAVNNFPPTWTITDSQIDEIRQEVQPPYSADQAIGIYFLRKWGNEELAWNIKYIPINCSLTGPKSIQANRQVSVTVAPYSNSELIGTSVYYSGGPIEHTITGNTLLFTTPDVST